MDVYAAMREAGLTRFRPILMTALSTIAGILPIAIGLGSGAESRRPMGITIVGGMITSGILTLYVIPMMYVLFHHIQNWFTKSKPVD
jgi:hydrophobic/amphiphilic exporter-1 (mainly G- bacteria), HAE1 family